MRRVFYLAVALVAIDTLMSGVFWQLESNPLAHAIGFGPFIGLKGGVLVAFIGVYHRYHDELPTAALAMSWAIAVFYGAMVASNLWVLLS